MRVGGIATRLNVRRVCGARESCRCVRFGISVRVCLCDVSLFDAAFARRSIALSCFIACAVGRVRAWPQCVAGVSFRRVLLRKAFD